MADVLPESVLEVPVITPFQIDGGGSDAGKGVNLFRGDVTFALDLVTLEGRNGLNVRLAASYASNVAGEVSASNADAPTSVLGLGWNLPYDAVVVDANGTGARDDNVYYLLQNGSRNRLYRSARTWQRATVDPAFAGALDARQLTPALLGALRDEGLELDAAAAVAVDTPGAAWTITDTLAETVFRFVARAGAIAVLDGGDAYELQSYQFWRIRYYAPFERWEITRQDGCSIAFGGGVTVGEDGERSTASESIQWGVRWGNWIGASALTHDPNDPALRVQQQFARSWNQVATRSPWGDEIRFAYAQVRQRVGGDGLTYTKACYLTRIVDVYGRTVELTYDDKTYVASDPSGAREYADPHKPVPNDVPDAFQTRYETKYLRRIDVRDEEAVPLFALDLESETRNFATIPSTAPPSFYGDTCKRVLRAVTKTMPDGSAMPPLEFSYLGTADINAGALGQALYPNGARAVYAYQPEDLPLCSRSLRIDAPLANGSPRVWFGSDYAVVCWYDPNGRLSLDLYTFLGRWQRWTPAGSPFSVFLDPDTLEVTAQPEFFVLTYASTDGQTFTLRAFHKDDRTLGAWIPLDQAVTTAARSLRVAAGAQYFAFGEPVAATLSRYTWIPAAQRWNVDDAGALRPLCSPDVFGERRVYAGGAANYLLTFCYDEQSPPGSKNSTLLLQYLDELGVWRAGDATTLPDLEIAGPDFDANFTWSTSAAFACATVVTRELPGALDYSLVVVQWDADAYRFTPVAVLPYQSPKISDTGTRYVPYVAVASESGTIASGPHLLRYNGSSWLANDALAIQIPPAKENLYWFAYGPDVALKTENTPNTILSVLQAYDPNTQITAWNESLQTIVSGAAPPRRLTRWFPTAGGDWVSDDVNLYARGTSNDWIEPLQTTVWKFALGTNTTTVINEGPVFFAHLVETGGDKPQPQYTEVTILRDGFVTRTERIEEAFFRVISADGSHASSVNGKVPAGPLSFVTYLPLDASFDQARSITLFRFVQNSIREPFVSYPVASVAVNDGYGTVSTAYAFDTAAALCDPSGTVAKFFTGWEYPGAADPGTASDGSVRYEFVNGLPGGDPGNVERTGPPSLLDGSLVRRTTTGADGAVVFTSEVDWDVRTTVTDLDSGATVPIAGAYIRPRRTASTKDGVPGETAFTYDEGSGQPATTTQSVLNARGELETYVASARYCYAVYDRMRAENVLTPVAQRTVSVASGSGAPVVTGVDVATWTPFPRPVAGGNVATYAARTTYRWLGGGGSSDFDFARWSSGGAPADWFPGSTVTVRSAHGLVVDRMDPNGETISTLYDRDEELSVAVFSGASVAANEAYYYGFEAYEDPRGWAIDLAVTPIVSGDACTGRRSLRLPPGTTGASFTLAASDLSDRRQFAYRARGAATYAGGAGFRLALARGGTRLGQDIDVPLAAGAVTWTYAWSVLDLAAYGSGALTITVTPYNASSVDVLVDNVSFASYAGAFVADVYDAPYHTVSAEIGPYDVIRRTAYDAYQQPVALVGPNDSVESITVSYLSRQNSAEFDPAEPNSAVLAQPSGATFYDRFENGGDWAANWTASVPNDWTSAGGALRHAGTQPGTIALRDPAFSGNYAFYASVEADSPPGAPLGMAIGTALSVLYDPSSRRWTLADSVAGLTLKAPAGDGPGHTWLLVLMQGLVAFFAAGRRIFAYETAGAPTGAPTLVAGSPVAFSDVIVGAAPQLGAKYLDAGAKERQGQSVEAGGALVNAVLYDELGRGAVVTKIARVGTPGPLLAYRPGFVHSFDWESGVMTGEIAAAYPDDEGYPYSRHRYERSPLGRIVEVGVPGKAFAITDVATTSPDLRHTTKYAYGANAAGEFPAPLHLPAGQYYERTTVDADGRVNATTLDKLGRTVAAGTLNGARYVMQTYDTKYVATGSVATVYRPNYYNPPDSARRDDWKNVTTFDMIGRASATVDADAGAVTSIFDRRGSLRFRQDARSRDAGMVLYATYDTFGRLQDEGSIARAWDPVFLQQRANDDPSWPSPPDGAVVRKRSRYDGDGTDPAQMGHLVEVQMFDGADLGAPAYRRTMHYDVRSRIVREEVTVPQYDAAAQRVSYGYDNLTHLVRLESPTGLVQTFAHDELGRVRRIADGSGSAFATYDYFPQGHVATETLAAGTPGALARNYAYAPPGWPSAVGGETFSQTLDYTANGYGGAGYYSGLIARTSSTLAGAPAQTSQYAYDSLNRVATAETRAGGGVVADATIGGTTPVSYDDNGNFLVVPTPSANETYRYQPGTDFVLGTDGGTQPQYERGAGGTVTSAKPRGIRSIDYDAVSGLPKTMQLANGSNVVFEYDDASWRSLKTSGNDERLYVRGPYLRPLTERERVRGGAPSSSRDYVYGPLGLVAIVVDGKRYGIVRDYLSSTRVVVDEQKNVVASLSYDAFGRVLQPQGGPADLARYLFTGHEYDAETQLYNAGARLYDPQLRRFYAVDPMRQYASPYVYAGNNPMVLVDPDGQFSLWAFLIGVALAIVGAVIIIATAGAATPLIAIGETTLLTGAQLGAVAGATVLGAGINGAAYGATHNGFNGREFGTALGVGAAAGAVTAISGLALSVGVNALIGAAVSRITGEVAASVLATRPGLSLALGVGRGIVVGGPSAVFGRMTANAIVQRPVEDGLGLAFGLGAGLGAAVEGFGALMRVPLLPAAAVRPNLVASNPSVLDNVGEDPIVQPISSNAANETTPLLLNQQPEVISNVVASNSNDALIVSDEVGPISSSSSSDELAVQPQPQPVQAAAGPRAGAPYTVGSARALAIGARLGVLAYTDYVNATRAASNQATPPRADVGAIVNAIAPRGWFDVSVSNGYSA